MAFLAMDLGVPAGFSHDSSHESHSIDLSIERA